MQTTSESHILPLQKQSRNDVNKIVQKRSVRNAHCPEEAITKITGIITPESIDTLENKLGGAFTIIKSTHFVDGQCYGYLASVIPQEKYRVVISDPAWVYVAPANPGAYSAAALVAGVSTAQQEQLVAQHKEAQTTYANYIGAQEAGKRVVTIRCRCQCARAAEEAVH
jgi:hypothetical protein